MIQIGFVHEYYLEFIALANRVHIELPEALLYCFISGLKSDIRQDVVSQCPATLFRAVTLAKLYEEKYITSFAPSFMPNFNKTSPLSAKMSIPHHTFPKSNLSQLLPTPNVPPSKTMVKKMSAVEMR